MKQIQLSNKLETSSQWLIKIHIGGFRLTEDRKWETSKRSYQTVKHLRRLMLRDEFKNNFFVKQLTLRGKTIRKTSASPYWKMFLLPISPYKWIFRTEMVCFSATPNSHLPWRGKNECYWVANNQKFGFINKQNKDIHQRGKEKRRNSSKAA